MKSKIFLLPMFFGFIFLIGCDMDKNTNDAILFVGTYTKNGSEGIYRFNFNVDTGRLSDQTLAAQIENPSFITFSPDKKTLYAVGEVDNYKDGSGVITTFDVKDTVLTKLDMMSTFGANPCYVGVSGNGRHVAVANYTGGNFTIYNTQENGALLPSPQVIDHKVLDTSKTAHAHMAKFFDDELFVADLGLDRIKKYSKQENVFVPSEQKELVLASGAGPRHFVASANGIFLYVINELNSTITLFKKIGGSYETIAVYNTLSDNFKGESFCADIHLSPDGKYLYGSNRGENTIVIFKVNETSGKLALVAREPVKGDWPRNFTIDPSGSYVLVANQRSNNIVVFKRDIEKGTLSFINEVDLPSPVCLKFY
ncbi:6-phosphogluconolactonase [Maribacter sedimenticola]|uniref:6-phosphogluconolactonase n=2 Tax=Maribacter sedimenticola TaxID=228956 RepID=A0ABY1SIX2_9FLAO|nr:6-phosphogluconolactonase [Maribacter sedimenticola]